MRIQHNIAALNSYRNLTGNNSAVSKNLEKLSSGYRINRAGDDAAGLAISEKMRAQITGLNTAQKNAQDGVSLVQTAEGAMTEVHSMLNRMVELADQSANGTNADEVDRENLQKEISSLKDEIDRIADSTNFNGINLLDGSLKAGGGQTLAGDISVSNTKVVTGSTTTADFTDGTGGVTKGDEVSYTVAWTDKDGKELSKTIKLTVNSDKKLVGEDGTVYEVADPSTKVGKNEIQNAVLGELKKDKNLSESFDIEISGDALKFTSKVEGSNGATIDAIDMVSSNSTAITEAGGAIGSTVKGENSYQQFDLSKLTVITGNEKPEDIASKIFEVNGKKFILGANTLTDQQIKDLGIGSDVNVIKLTGSSYTSAQDAKNVAAAISRETGLELEVDKSNNILYKGDIELTKSAGNGGLTLQIGDTADSFNQMKVSVGDMHTKALGIADIDISTQAGAQAAVDKIKSAINSVSSTRGDLGAIQNRLEHTINNLSVSSENMTAAESRIRDVDMANEMMAYTKNNILVQSSQAMLAQANQLPQGVLQLLQ